MYRITMLAVGILFCLFAWAQDGNPNAVIIEMKDGSTVSCLFRELPELSFSGSDLVVTTSRHQLTYPQSSVRRYLFGWVDDAGVESVTIDDVLQVGDHLVVSNLSKGDQLSLYGLNGVLISSAKAGGDGRASLAIGHLPAGIYLVKYKDTTVKVQKL